MGLLRTASASIARTGRRTSWQYGRCGGAQCGWRANQQTDAKRVAVQVWVPAQIINFGFSPLWFRIPFTACVSAFWTCFVSMTRGAPEA